MFEISLVFPNQLYPNAATMAPTRKCLLVEEELYFSQYHFHKNKLVLHRASMKYYQKYLQANNISVDYIEANESHSNTSLLFAWLKKQGITKVHLTDPVDYLLSRRLKRYSELNHITLVLYDNPNFICTTDYIHDFFNKKKRYFLHDFYVAERKRNNWLMEAGGPIGGVWSFDTENRKKLPKGIMLPSLKNYATNELVSEAINYVNTHFKTNPGETDHFCFPVDRNSALKQLEDFLRYRFNQFGEFQDAIKTGDSWLFHSHISAALNIGLLDPREVVEAAIKYGSTQNIPVNAVEGFIRQIMGWREYIRAVYIREGVKERTRNFWGFDHKMPASFWSGTTGIEPVDDVIRKVVQTGYSNHIERLMILGNFMGLCEIEPNAIYEWFMTFYIDAYDWVMVPNVYGMSQYADGGLMSTKPYISGSNYILKMSDHKKGAWCDIWDALFWRFMIVHRDFFSKNPRLSMLLKNADKMPPEKRENYLAVAEGFLSKLHAQS